MPQIVFFFHSVFIDCNYMYRYININSIKSIDNIISLHKNNNIFRGQAAQEWESLPLSSRHYSRVVRSNMCTVCYTSMHDSIRLFNTWSVLHLVVFITFIDSECLTCALLVLQKHAHSGLWLQSKGSSME